MREVISEIAFVSFTKNGAGLAGKIRRKIGGSVFVFHRYASGDTKAFDDTGTLIATLFDECRAIIFIGACGIAVRAVSPYVKSKKTDPAVIAVDEKGRYVIPLLSGHIGGANELAERIAEITGGEAVITTATDINGKFAVDVYAQKHCLAIGDFDAAKKISAALLNGEKVGFVSEIESFGVPEGLCGDTECEYGICVSEEEKKPFLHTLNLYPKNLVLGIGCRRGAASIDEAARGCAGDISRICAVVSIDLKRDEAAILNFCRANRIKFITCTAEELMNTEGDFSSSEFVKDVTGADNVCERSVVCFGAELIKKKRVCGGVTAALGKIKPPYLFGEEKV